MFFFVPKKSIYFFSFIGEIFCFSVLQKQKKEEKFLQVFFLISTINLSTFSAVYLLWLKMYVYMYYKNIVVFLLSIDHPTLSWVESILVRYIIKKDVLKLLHVYYENVHTFSVCICMRLRVYIGRFRLFVCSIEHDLIFHYSVCTFLFSLSLFSMFDSKLWTNVLDHTAYIARYSFVFCFVFCFCFSRSDAVNYGLIWKLDNENTQHQCVRAII